MLVIRALSVSCSAPGATSWFDDVVLFFSGNRRPSQSSALPRSTHFRQGGLKGNAGSSGIHNQSVQTSLNGLTSQPLFASRQGVHANFPPRPPEFCLRRFATARFRVSPLSEGGISGTGPWV
jgi:hypothetical protein